MSTATLIFTIMAIVILVQMLMFHFRHPSPEEKNRHGYSLWQKTVITISIFTVIVAIYVLWRQQKRKSITKSETSSFTFVNHDGAEHGFFGNKKKTEAALPERKVYGNPMKSQNYVPGHGVKTDAKTDSTKIFIKMGAKA